MHLFATVDPELVRTEGRKSYFEVEAQLGARERVGVR
jgi:hypothetical protein